MTENDFSIEVLQKAYDAAGMLYHLFTIKPDQYAPTASGEVYISQAMWDDMLYTYVPDCLYETMGSMTGPDGRPYLPAYVLSQSEIADLIRKKEGAGPAAGSAQPAPLRTLRNYASVNNYAAEALAGIAFLAERTLNTIPAATLRFGAVWSYEVFAAHGGPPTVRQNFYRAFDIDARNPYEVLVSDSDQVETGEPSDEYFPPLIRRLITEEVQQTLPGAHVTFYVFRQEKMAMADSIFIGIEADAPRDLKIEIMQNLTWYMPPFLPLTGNP